MKTHESETYFYLEIQSDVDLGIFQLFSRTFVHFFSFPVELGVGALNMDHLDNNMNSKFSEDHREEPIDVVGMESEGIIPT